MEISLGKWVPSVEKLTRWADGVKSASITLLAVGAAAVTAVGIYRSVTTDFVSVEPIKVPAPFEEQGYTSDIATARLLDEIVTFQRGSASEKDRVSVLNKSYGDDLDKLQPSFGGLDVQRVQQVVQDSLGIKKQRITGEITFKKDGDNTVYHVRLRRLPVNQVLLDISTAGPPEQVLKKTAMAMIEVFDPHIAANLYWRDRDEDNALRMIDIVLNSERKNDYKYSLSLRGNIHISHKQFDEAKRDFEQIMAIDPNFAAGHRMAASRFLAQGEPDESLRESDKAIELAPTKWYGYFQKAQALKALKRNDEAETNYAKTISLKPPGPGPYLQAAQFYGTQNKLGEAETVIRQGLANFPESSILQAGLGDLLRREGQSEAALRAYRRALEFDPKNQIAIAAKNDLEKSSEISDNKTK